MDPNTADSDDLKKLERQLAAWQPASEGLDADAMLFAAGRASARGGKAWLAWPIVSACLAAAVVALGAGLATERSERLALVRQLQQRPHQVAPAADETPATDAPAPDAYLVLLREWEQHPNDWGGRAPATGQVPKRPAAPEPPTPRAWPPDGLPDPL
jgi:hypothetical protein